MKGNSLNLEFVREFKKDKFQFISNLIAERGDAFMLKGPIHNVYFLSNPNLIQRVLLDNGENYIRPHNKIIESIFIGGAKLDDPNVQNLWKEDAHKVIYAALTKEAVKKHTENIVKSTAEFLNQWSNNVKSHEPIKLPNTFYLLLLSNLTKSLLNNVTLNINEVADDVHRAMYLMTAYELSATKLPWILPTKLHRETRRVTKALDKVLNSIAEQCLSDKVPDENLLKILAKNHADIDQKKYTRIRAAFLLIPGFHPVAGCLTFACVYLSLYPTIAQKIYEEVKTVLGDRELTINDLANLRYTQAVIFETLRLSGGIAPILPRVALSSDKIGNFNIKKNDLILIPTFYMHRLPEYWKNPEGFDPSRFLTPLPDRYKCIYIPFGAGPHGCVGRHFGILETTIVLAMIVQRYRLYLKPNQHIDSEVTFSDPDLHKEIMMTVRNAGEY